MWTFEWTRLSIPSRIIYNPRDNERILNIIIFQFHQGLSQQSQLPFTVTAQKLSIPSRIIDDGDYFLILTSHEAFNSIKDYLFYRFGGLKSFLLPISFNSIKDYLSPTTRKPLKSLLDLSIPSRIILIFSTLLKLSKLVDFQFHQGLSKHGETTKSVVPDDNFQFHQGLSRY